MGQDATTASMNSFNSAASEQIKYNESLEARINRLSNATYGLASSVGESVLYDSIVVITEGLNKLTDSGSGVVSSIGAFAPLFGMIGVAAYALSGNLRTLVTTTYATAAANVAATGSTGLLARGMTALSASTALASTALKSLGFALGIGAVFAALGFAIEKVTGAMSDMIQEQEAIDRYNKQNIEAMTLNKESTEELIDSYISLRKAREDSDDWDSEKEKEYLQVQQSLSEVFPALIDKIDSTGQAHLKNEDLIKKEIEATEKLIDAQNRLTLASASEEFKNLKTEIDGGAFGSMKNFLYGDLEEQIKNTKMAIEGLSKRGLDTSEQEVKLINLQAQYQTASEQIKDKIYVIVDAISALNDTDIDDNLSSSVKGFVSSLDLSNLNEDELNAFSNAIGNFQVKLQQAMDTKDAGLFKSTIDEINNLASVSKNFEEDIDGFALTYEGLGEAINSGNGFIDTSIDELNAVNGSANSAEDAVTKLAESILELKSVEEQLTGTSYNHVKSSEELIFMYDTLTSRLNGLSDQELQAILSKQNLSNEEKFLVQAMQERGDTIAQLSVLYPQFAKLQKGQISLSAEQVKAMKSEQEANKVLLEAYKLSSEGKYSAEQAMTLAQATATKARIDNIKAEIQAMDILNQELQKYVNNLKTARQAGETDEDYRRRLDNEGKAAMRGGSLIENNNSSISSRTSELNGLQSQLTTSVGSLKAINTAINDTSKKSSKASEKTTKESTKNAKESIYISDKYKQALEKINLEIEKQQNLQDKFPKYSDEYRKSLLTQIKLEKEKLSILKSQQAELNKQIKSGNIKETGIIDVTPSSTTKTTTKSTPKKLNGWSGSTTSGFGMRMHPTLGVYKMHEGIDIAGKRGTRLDSNVNGKVVSQGYNSVSGNYVKIQDSNGFKHFYAHLDKAFVKLGDMVEAGTQIGNIGKTGRVTGSHLHYGVQDKNGKYIDPSTYVKSAKNNKVVTSSTTTASNEKSASQIKAEKQQALDNAKSEQITNQQNILAQEKMIENLEKVMLIEADLAKFDRKRSLYDASLDYESTKIQELDTNSARYTATLENMVKYMNKKQVTNQQELKYLQSAISSGKYQGDALDNLKDRYAALNTEMKATQIEIKNTNLEILKNIKTQSDELISDVEYQMSRAKAIQSLYDEGSGDWVELAEEEIDLQKELTKLYKQQYDDLQKDITARSLTAEGVKELTADLQNLSVAYWNSLSAEKAMTKALEDSQKAILSNMADEIISNYKDVYSEKQDIHMESLESERRAEEKAHQARMKEIEDEMNLYRKSVQEKIDLINKQESERDYNMEVSEMESERSKVAKKLNEVQFDNSHEGKAERKKLQEQLDKIDKDIAEKRHDRDIQLQTDALNEMLELKEEESQGMQDIETERYESVIDNIDRQKEYWGKYYNDLINDERKFAKLREDIMNKNFDNIEKEFGGFIDELNASLPSLEDTMDGTMGAVGTSIRVNIIDNLQRALDMLAEFESKQAVTNSHSTMGSGSVSSPTGSGKSTLSNGDMQVLLGKFMTESLANEETDAKRKATIKNKAYEIASSGRKAGSTIGANESLQSVVSGLSKEDKEALSAYINSRAGSIVSTPALQDYIRNYVKQLLSSSASLSVGGMIPRATGGIDGKGGRGIIVHPEEIISNPIDSKNMVVASSIMERVASMISLPKLNSLFSPANSGDGVEINFNIDKMYGTEQEANGILSKINTTMKTRFGGGL